MDRVRLLQLRDELLTERAELTETLTALEAALGGVEKLLARATPPETREVQVGFDAVLVEPPNHPTAPSHPAPAPKDEPPRGSRAVETILMDTGVWMSVQELAAEQLERGWPPESDDPVSAVRAAANRLVANKPDLFVREHGRYRYLGVGQQASLNGNGPESAQAEASTPPADQQPSATGHQTGGDWLSLPRTDAVERMLILARGPLSPSELSRRLQRVGRDDPPLAVGKALNHLYRKHRANTVGRAKWVLTDPNDPWLAPSATDVSQEPEEVSSDQEMRPAVPAFTGDGQQPDESPDQY